MLGCENWTFAARGQPKFSQQHEHNGGGQARCVSSWPMGTLWEVFCRCANFSSQRSLPYYQKFTAHLHGIRKWKKEQIQWPCYKCWERHIYAIDIFISTSGGMGKECEAFHRRVAQLVSMKRNEKYSHVMGYICTRIRFALLKSVLISIRGVRGKESNNEVNISQVSFNMIPGEID